MNKYRARIAVHDEVLRSKDFDLLLDAKNFILKQHDFAMCHPGTICHHSLLIFDEKERAIHSDTPDSRFAKQLYFAQEQYKIFGDSAT